MDLTGDEIYNNFNQELNKHNENFVILLIGGSTAQAFPDEILEEKYQKS